MKAEKLQSELNYSVMPQKYVKSRMYEFDFSTCILVQETHDNGSVDNVFLDYFMNCGDKAYFSEEYLPMGKRKEGVKKPDITAIIENSYSWRVKWYIYDIKDTVIKGKVASKLCNQWHQGIEHITSEYLREKSAYDVEPSIGVVTRYWDKKLLEVELNSYEEKLGKKNELLTARKSLVKVGEYREIIRAIKNILDGIFEDYNEITGEWNKYQINYIELNKSSDLEYTTHLEIKFEKLYIEKE